MAMLRDWFGELTFVHQEMERLLDDFSRRKPPPCQFSLRIWEPAVDVCETSTQVIVTVELAGVSRDNLEVKVDRQKLYLRGERGEPNQEERCSCHRLEIYWGPFERTVPLPCPVEADSARATFHSGLLEVTLSKSVAIELKLKLVSEERE